MNKKCKIILNISLGCLLVIFGVFLFYSNRFLPGSTVNGIPVSNVHKANLKNYLENWYQNNGYIKFKNGEQEYAIKLSGLDFSLVSIDGINDTGSSWINGKYSANIKFNMSTKKLFEDLLADNSILKKTKESKNAEIVKTNQEFKIDEGSIGDEIDINKLKIFLLENQTKLEIDLQDFYKLPKITKEELKDEFSKLDFYNKFSLKVDLTANEFDTISFDTFSNWIESWEKGNIVWNDKLIKEYVTKSLAKVYNTIGVPKSFTTHSGKSIKISNKEADTLGWQLDVKETSKRIKNALVNKETNINAKWSLSNGEDRKNNEIGDTYIEVDLSLQKLFYFKDSKLVLETPIVSGLPEGSRETPTGCFKILNKSTNSILRGGDIPVWVQYWMPFTWRGDGIHDSNWQSSYGGERYKYYGSHGCINTPLDKVKELYNIVEVGTPVIVHK